MEKQDSHIVSNNLSNNHNNDQIKAKTKLILYKNTENKKNNLYYYCNDTIEQNREIKNGNNTHNYNNNNISDSCHIVFNWSI